MKRILTIIFLLFMVCVANGQNCLSFLNESEVRDLVSVDQYVWSATSGGLVRFDTITKIKTYFNTENSELPINGIKKLTLDGNDNIWMICEGNVVARYNGSGFTSYDIQSQFSIPYDAIATDIIYYNNKIYVSYNIDWLFVFDGAHWSNIHVNFAGKNSICRVIMMKTYQNYLYLSLECYASYSSASYIKYDGTTFFLIKSFTLASSQPASIQNATFVFDVDLNGNIWLAQNEGGLIMLDVVTLNVTVHRVPAAVRNCPYLYIYEIFIHHNIVFCGGAGKNGLITYNIAGDTWNSINTSNSLMSFSDLNTILPISYNSVYVGNKLNLIHIKFPSQTVELFSFTTSAYNLNKEQTVSFVGDSIFVGGYRAFGENDSLKIYNIPNNSWTTSTFGGFASYPQQVIKDNLGVLWLGNVYGLYFYEATSNTWIQYTLNRADTITDVRHLCVDKLDNIWIQRGNGSLVKITSSGVASTVTTHATTYGNIYFDGLNSVYVGGGPGYGLLKIDINTDAVTSMDTDNFGYTFNYVFDIIMANGIIYLYDGSVIAKVNGSQIIRIFEVSDYAPHYTIKVPVAYGVRSVAVDQQGNFYFTDDYSNKLYVYSLSTGFTYYDYTNSCLSFVYKVYIDNQNDIWVLGDGLYKMDHQDILTSIQQPNDDNLSLQFYPNPVQDEGMLVIPYSHEQVQSITLYNTQSSVMKTISGNESSDPNIVSISVADLPKGIYVLKVKFMNDTYGVSKFVKM